MGPWTQTHLHEAFTRTFGCHAATIGSAPGRVNLIGEHTDYNGGWVLPIAIELRTHVVVARRADSLMRVVSTDVPHGAAALTFDLTALQATGRWPDYLQGMCAELLSAGHSLGGVDVFIASKVPLGAGLSSSAALEVAFGRALRELFGLRLSDVDLAVLGMRCENNFVGAAVGIMDPMAVSVGQEGNALLLETTTLQHVSIALPKTVQLGVIHSGVRHANNAGDYNQRRRQCEDAAVALGVSSLGQLDAKTDATVLDRLRALPRPLNQRARHVVLENARVHAAADALRRGDVQTLGALLDASHASLRDDYEVSIPAVDALVRHAQADADVLGARITGGGFGGCVIVLAHAGCAAAAVARILAAAAAEAPAAHAVLPTSVPANAAKTRREARVH